MLSEAHPLEPENILHQLQVLLILVVITLTLLVVSSLLSSFAGIHSYYSVVLHVMWPLPL